MHLAGSEGQFTTLSLGRTMGQYVLVKVQEASPDLTDSIRSPSPLPLPTPATAMTTRRSPATTTHQPLFIPFLLICSYLLPFASAYRPGDIVPMLRSGQYHGVIRSNHILSQSYMLFLCFISS